jgi:AmmeMemoRadiSam system protein A
MLGEADRRSLLQFLRQSLQTHLAGRPLPTAPWDRGPLADPAAAFVTLRLPDGELRGCIGFVKPVGPLWRTAREAAVRAATEDTRFKPVSAAELPQLRIQVSVLSEPAPTPADAVEVGRHGLVIRMEGRSGLLLPQVADEFQLDRLGFLEAVCRKAGLPPDAWKEPQAALLSFTAEVFGEA